MSEGFGENPNFWESIRESMDHKSGLPAPRTQNEAIRAALPSDEDITLSMLDPDIEQTRLVRRADGTIEEVQGEE